MTDSMLRERAGALFLRVRASPGSSRQGIQGRHANALKIAVRAAPEKGKANEAIARVLAEALGLRAAQIALESGEYSRDKSFRISGLSLTTVEEKLNHLLKGS